MSRPLPVNLYCVWQWWERHYQAAAGRPDCIDPGWLDATLAGRRRALGQWFGDLGLGAPDPAADAAFAAQVLPLHTMLVPAVLGMSVTVRDNGGLHNHHLPAEAMDRLEPVDLAASPVGELVLAEKAKREARYGRASAMIDLGSAANNAFMLQGTDFYLDLAAEPERAARYLAVVTETMLLAARFLAKHFGPGGAAALGNCNVTMMSPATYETHLRPHDIRFVTGVAAIHGQAPACDLHHCNVPTEPFADAYAAIPGLRSLQGSVLSDLGRIRARLPGVAFSGMISPVDLLHRPEADLLAALTPAVAGGVDDLVLWDVDAAVTPGRLGAFLRGLAALARAHGREPVFSCIPMSWEELDWEFPVYRRGAFPAPA